MIGGCEWMLDFSMKRLGQSICDLRKARGMSQQELADGICTQAQISKIEKGNTNTSVDILYKIIKRLGVDYHYFFQIAESQRGDYEKEITIIIRKAVSRGNYVEVMEIVNNAEILPLFQTDDNKQFLLWHKGISTFYLNKDPFTALDLLKQSFNLTAENKIRYAEREVEILISIGIIHSEIYDYKKGIEYFKGKRQTIHTF